VNGRRKQMQYIPGRKLTNIVSNEKAYISSGAARSDHHVIARKSEALTWQSPGKMLVLAVQIGEWYQEIATSLRSSQ